MLSYKISIGEVKVLIEGMQFANGVQIHPDKKSVLFTESLMARVHRYYFTLFTFSMIFIGFPWIIIFFLSYELSYCLQTFSIILTKNRYYFTGPKKGQDEIFVENLPGTPDNIRLSRDGQSLYLALFRSRPRGDPSKENTLDSLAPWPLLRKAFGEAILILFKFMQDRNVQKLWLHHEEDGSTGNVILLLNFWKSLCGYGELSLCGWGGGDPHEGEVVGEC